MCYTVLCCPVLFCLAERCHTPLDLQPMPSCVEWVTYAQQRGVVETTCLSVRRLSLEDCHGLSVHFNLLSYPRLVTWQIRQTLRLLRNNGRQHVLQALPLLPGGRA